MMKFYQYYLQKLTKIDKTNILLMKLIKLKNFINQVQKIFYFLLCNKKSRFDFADELKVGDVRYKHLT